MPLTWALTRRKKIGGVHHYLQPWRIEVVQQLASFLVARGVASHGTQQRAEASLIQLVPASLDPGFGLRRTGSIHFLADDAEVLFSVPAVHDLNGLRIQLIGQIPDPGRAVAEHD